MAPGLQMTIREFDHSDVVTCACARPSGHTDATATELEITDHGNHTWRFRCEFEEEVETWDADI